MSVDTIKMLGDVSIVVTNNSELSINELEGTGTLTLTQSSEGIVTINSIVANDDGAVIEVVSSEGTLAIDYSSGPITQYAGFIKSSDEDTIFVIENTLTLSDDTTLVINVDETASINHLVIENGSIELVYSSDEVSGYISRLTRGLYYSVDANVVPNMSVTESDTGELLAITFDVMSIGTIDGNFDNITVDGEISGYTWNTENVEETGELVAIKCLMVGSSGVQVIEKRTLLRFSICQHH